MPRAARFKSRNEVVRGIERGIASGHYQDCLHLKYGDLAGDYDIQYDFENTIFGRYVIVCERDSFTPNANGAAICPKDCVFFCDRGEALAEAAAAHLQQVIQTRALSSLRWFGRLIAAPFVWFQKLSGITQVLIIVLILMCVYPSLVEPIKEFVAALK